MSKRLDLKGKKFGKLIAIEPFNNVLAKKRLYWKCKCDCGNITDVESYKLKSGHTRSCGCLVKNNRKTHNLSKTKLYKTFHDMKARCYNKNNKSYKYYGKLGIKICDEWLNDFVKFYNWAIKSGYNHKLTIDRIYPDGNYEPNNCQWISIQRQQNKRRDTNLIYYKNKFMTLKEISKCTNLKYGTLRSRLNRLKHNSKKFIEYIEERV